MRGRGVLLVFAGLGLLAAAARADWPMARRDPERTAYAPGSTFIHRAAPLWRYFLGGTLGREQYWAGDLDGDGRGEVVFLSGGKVVSKLPNDTVVMDSPLLDLFRIDRVGDLDGDGTREIVASAAAGRVFVIGADGAVLWQTPDGSFGNIGAVRFGDFDGDGRDEMYVADQACGSSGSLGDVARVYSFAGGVAATTPLFQLERGRRDYVCGNYDTLGDFNGDGRLEILAQGNRVFYVYSGSDGRLLAQTADLGSIPYGLTITNVQDLDGDPAQEVVCFANNSYAPAINSRRVFLMDWDPAGGTLVKRWERSVTDVATEEHRFVHNGTVDLDGDGTWEVVTSFWASPRARLHVLDARDGTTIDSVLDATLEAVLDLDGDGTVEVLGRSEAGALTAYEFRSLSLVPRWTLPGRRVVGVVDTARRDVQAGYVVPLALDVDGDGRNELLLTRNNADGEIAELLAYDAELAAPAVAASYPLPAGTVPLTYEPFADITGPGEGLQIGLARNDGYLVVLGRGLVPLNEPGGDQAGLRIGGYYSGHNGLTAAPVAADLDADGWNEVVVRNSRGALDCLRPAGASLVVPPAVAWSRPREFAPTLLDVDGDGDREVASLWTSADPTAPHQVRLTAADGTTVVWTRPVTAAGESVTYDLVPMGDLNGDGRLDLLYHRMVQSTGNAKIDVLDGATGAPLWATPFETLVAGSGYGDSAAFDLTGDGLRDPLVCPRNTMMQLRPADGTVVTTVDAGYCTFPSIWDVNRDGQPEVISSGSHYALRVFTRSMTELWRETGTKNHTRTAGAVAECPDAVRFAEGSNNSAVLDIWNAATGALLTSRTLAGGAIYATEADARAAGQRLGILGNAVAKQDLTGAGTPGVLVGSTDGWLYAVDPCTATLVWSYNFRYPVGEPVFADVTDDGADDLLVSVADGYLYAVGRERFRAPAEVLDVDPPAGFPAEDRDTIETFDTLYAAWSAVTGAASYEYAVLTAGGTFLTRPNFLDAGSSTTATAAGLGLRLGGTYYVAVRAIGPSGSSAEMLSDGIQVVDETPPAITLRAGPTPFTPDGDGVEDTVSLVADLADRTGLVEWAVTIFQPGGMAVARTFPPRALTGAAASDFVVWDGRDDGGTLLYEADYPAIATVTDGAGHTATATVDLQLRLPGGADADADADGDGDAEAVEDGGADADEDGPADGGADADEDGPADGGADGDADAGADGGG
ncbi:MAG: VCBS repeat-containing protein, partial [Myxococcales bacterium]|nr:VCBS repeat-containing protein [Myxococcales bacterium]